MDTDDEERKKKKTKAKETSINSAAALPLIVFTHYNSDKWEITIKKKLSPKESDCIPIRMSLRMTAT